MTIMSIRYKLKGQEPVYSHGNEKKTHSHPYNINQELKLENNDTCNTAREEFPKSSGWKFYRVVYVGLLHLYQGNTSAAENAFCRAYFWSHCLDSHVYLK